MNYPPHNYQQTKNLFQLNQKEEIITLQPVTMRIPNSYNIYSPSKLMPKRQVSYSEFISRYAEEPRRVKVCFEDTSCLETMHKKSHQVTAYNCGLGCWYIVEQD